MVKRNTEAELPFYELQRHVKEFTSITAHALLEEFGEHCRIWNDAKKRNVALERLHRTTEFLVAYLFEMIFPAHQLVYAKDSIEGYNVYRDSWLRVLAAFAKLEELGEESDLKSYYDHVHAYKTFIDEQAKGFEGFTNKQKAMDKWYELKEKNEAKGTWPIPPIPGGSLQVTFSELMTKKSALFNAWVEKYSQSGKITRTGKEKLKEYFGHVQCEDGVKKWIGSAFPEDPGCWFALHFWHHREEFQNRKLLLLTGKQWNEGMNRLMAVFPYSPVALPKVVFNPEAARGTRRTMNEIFHGLFIDDDRTPYHPRQGVCAFFRSDPTSFLQYMAEKGVSGLGMVVDPKKWGLSFVENGKANGPSGNNVKTFLTHVLAADREEEAYLTLVRSVEFWECWKKDYESKKAELDMLVQTVIRWAGNALNLKLTEEGAGALVQTMLTWDWAHMYMFPGELWNTIIGGVGCSFARPLTDVEFLQMRSLVQGMLSPYSLVERSILELSRHDELTIEGILHAGGKIDQINQEVRVFCEDTLYPLINEARSYVEPPYFTKLKQFLTEGVVGSLTHNDITTENQLIKSMFTQASENLKNLNLTEEVNELVEQFLEKGERDIYKEYLGHEYNRVPGEIRSRYNALRDNVFKVEYSTLKSIGFNMKGDIVVELYCHKGLFLKNLKHVVVDSSSARDVMRNEFVYELSDQRGLLFFLIASAESFRCVDLFKETSGLETKKGRFRNACLWLARYSALSILKSKDTFDLRRQGICDINMVKKLYPPSWSDEKAGSVLIFAMRP